jgi:hypothetical protein
MLIYDEGVRIANVSVLSWIPFTAFHYRAKMRDSCFFYSLFKPGKCEKIIVRMQRNKLLTEFVQYK